MNHLLMTCDQLSLPQREAMMKLLAKHFSGVLHDQFDRDLSNKTHVILLNDDQHHLVGFSTFGFEEVAYEQDHLSVVISGDTIVDPAAWGASTLSRVWIESVYRLHAASKRQHLFWLLICSGYRTYRFLPTFWRAYWPRHDRPTPIATKHMMDSLAQWRFGNEYNSATGVVRFDQPQMLRPHLRGIPEHRQSDPHVAFFDRVNPGHMAGDELVCLTAMDASNLTAAGRRMAGQRRCDSPILASSRT